MVVGFSDQSMNKHIANCDPQSILALLNAYDRLLAALEPFAAINVPEHLWDENSDLGLPFLRRLKAGDFRRARAALEGKP